MNERLRWITNLFDLCGIPYWVDCGTLLGLIREGDLLSKGRKCPDTDIDISLWSEYEPRIVSILPRIREAGYGIRRYSYKGLICKYFFINSQNLFPFIDVSVYRKNGDHAWCPENFPKANDTLGMARYVPTRIRDILRNLYWGLSPPQLHHMSSWPTVDMAAWPSRALYEVGTNWIPSFYFDDIMRADDIDVLLPRDWEGYLKLRYGDWRTPVEEWSWWLDEGGFERRLPHDIINDLSPKVRSKRGRSSA